MQQQFLEEEGLDIKKYIFKILTNWYWFVLTIFIGLSIAYYINRYAEEVYTVVASIVLNDNQSAGSIDNIFTEYLGRYRRRAVVENEISVLKSYRLAEQAIDELEEFWITYIAYGRIRERLLYKNAPFIVEVDTSEYNLVNYPVFISDVKENRFRLEINEHHEIDTILEFGQKYKTNIFSFTIYKTNNDANFSYNKYSFSINSKNNLANQYRNKLNIEVNDERGSILNLSLSGPIPQQVADYMNKLNETYIQYGLDEKNKTSELSIDFIEDQLQGIKDTVKKAETRLQNFRIQNQVFDLSSEGQLIFTKLDKYESEKSIISMQGNYFEYLRDYLEKSKNNNEIIAPSILGIQDNLLNNLVQEYNNIFSKKKVLEYSANPDNPGLEMLNIELNNIKKVLYENVHNLIENNNLSLASLDKKIKSIEKEIKRLPKLESKLLTFEREFNIDNNVYTYLLEKKAEAGITKASNVPDNKILDVARPDNAKQIAPKKKMNYLMGGFIGALLPLIIIILIDFFNNKIIEKKEIEEKSRVPILGSIGHNDKDSEIPVFENPKSHMAESFRSFRTNLKYMGKEGNQPRVICVTSTISGEGKTFCAINLAAILSLSNKKVLLVSLDLRKPKIHKVFNINNSQGISTYIIGKSTLDEVIVESAIANLSVAISGPVPPNPAELLDTEQIEMFFASMKKQFDYIVIDTPPIAIVTDALLIQKYTDLTLYVIRQNYSQRQVLDLVNELYNTKKIANIGLVVNDINTPGYYGYNYGYGYGYGYTYGYRYGRYSGYTYGHGYYGDEPEPKGLLRKYLSKKR